jgi:hypothetical protein
VIKSEGRKANEARKLAEANRARTEELRRKYENHRSRQNPPPSTTLTSHYMNRAGVVWPIPRWTVIGTLTAGQGNSFSISHKSNHTHVHTSSGPSTTLSSIPPVSYSVELFAGDAELAMGEVYGLRTWNVSWESGELTPRYIQRYGNGKRSVWTPGENIAVCHSFDNFENMPDPTGRGRKMVRMYKRISVDPNDFVNGFYGHTMRYIPARTIYHVQWQTDSFEPLETEEYLEAEFLELIKSAVRHRAPHEDCRCGFYAYTDPRHEEIAYDCGQIFGLIKGYGRTLIGSRGFRCEKAEIVALVNPAYPCTGGGIQRLQENYPGIPLVKSAEHLKDFADIKEPE